MVGYADWAFGDPVLEFSVDYVQSVVQILERRYDGYLLQYCGSKVIPFSSPLNHSNCTNNLSVPDRSENSITLTS